MRLKTVLIAAAMIAAAFFLSLMAADWLEPRRDGGSAPALVAVPPLPAMTRTSTIMVPVAISLTAVRDAAERGVPRNFAGKAKNPVENILQNADINWTAVRGPIAAAGAQDVLSLSSPLTGTLNVTGSLAIKGALGDALSSLLGGGNAAKQTGSVNIKNVNANADIRGSVTITSRPQLSANWRVEPNLNAQVNLGDTSLVVAGAKMNVPAQVKPMLDKAVNDQLATFQERIRNDPALEENARRGWAKFCRSMPLQSAETSLPPLWLEMRPTRAVAAQPRIDANAATLMLGIEAQSRVTSVQTTPDCPFPAAIEIVPPAPGRVNIVVPIEVPFAEINKIVEQQLTGKTFSKGSGSSDILVKRVTIAPSGDRLLASLLVESHDKKGWFGFSGDANLYIWGKPTLDQAQQTLRLTDIKLALESETTLGMLGAAVRGTIPTLERALAEKATVDLKPFAANAQKKIAALVADLQKNENGVRVEAGVTGLRLSEIAFDATTVRVIAEADGAVTVAISTLPAL
jgi:hypothetical protein